MAKLVARTPHGVEITYDRNRKITIANIRDDEAGGMATLWVGGELASRLALGLHSFQIEASPGRFQIEIKTPVTPLLIEGIALAMRGLMNEREPAPILGSP